MRKILALLPITLCFTAAPQNSSTSAQQAPIYITHVSVIDTERGKEATDQTVVISDGKITNVAQSKKLSAPTSARIVDGRGKYLIPGLWDMHVHRTEYESTYPMYLVNGVTGVREMAGPFDANKFRADLGAKKLDAPRFYFASPIVDGYPPRVSDQIVVKTAEEARRVVDDQKKAGADFIKVMDRLSRDAYFAIIDEAKRQDIPVVGHVPFAISAWEASAAGQKSIEHVHAVPLDCSTREAELRARLVATKENSWKLWNPIYIEAYESYSDEKCQRLFKEFKKNGTWSVPTLVVYRSTAMSSDPQFRNDERLRYFGGQLRTWLSKNAVMERKNFETSDFAIERELLNRRKWLVGKLFRAGVPMLAGTDTPNPFCFPGFGLHDELALMVESGVTPLGALQAATRNPALFLDATDKYGSVVPGKIADLVLLDADPLTDIRNTTKIREVFLGGKEFDRAALDEILRAAEAAASRPAKEETTAAEQVLAADEARRHAMLQGDVRALDSLLADDVTIVWGDGTTDNKASTLELFRSGRLRYQQSDYENTRVRVFGDIAIITGDARVKAVSDGESIAHLVRVTRVYALRQDRWQLVSVQTTRAAASSGGSLTGKMDMYNPLLGNPWTCTHQLGNQPPQKDAATVTFVIAPQNVLEIVISGPDFAARNFIGFDAKSNQYWRTEMGVFAGILRETSNDGVNFSGLNLGGPQARGTEPFPIRSVMTVPPDGKSSDLTEVFPETNVKLIHHCAR
jgi:ketosteroid isomerase-like protein